MDKRLYQVIVSALGKMTTTQLARLFDKIRALEYRRYRDDDSPKGENIPGVRYRIATLQHPFPFSP